MGDMESEMSYGPATTDAEQAGYARVLAHSFGRVEKESMEWIAKFPRGDTRVLKVGEKVVAGLILIPMGQFFGGASVPMTGVAAVGTAPEARGRGVALEMMQRCVLEMQGSGVPISGLYPATQRLYRMAGWEQSGHRFEVRVPLAKIGVREREMEVRPLEEADRARVQELYRATARHFDGNLDRAPIGWDRIERPPPNRTDPARAFVVEGHGGIEGYVYLTQQPPAVPQRGNHEVAVQDMLAATPGAARRLWTFLNSYATMANEMSWYAGPCHPMLAVLNEQPYQMTLHMHWMTRVVDVAKALEARGYAPGVRAAVGIEVTDELVGANNGSFVLEVSEGVGRVTKGKNIAGPRVKTTVNGLAAMYTGYMSAAALRSVGMVEGDDEAMAALGAVFAGGVPWMTDMF
jgi:predicted acetyltransferase